MKENKGKEENMDRREMAEIPGEEFFRERKEVLYRDIPEKLDQAVLAYSRKALPRKRFTFRLPRSFKAVAAILILALPITAVFLMESDDADEVRPGNKEIARTVKSSRQFPSYSRMDMADMELYELNRELELVQNLLVYSSSRDKKNGKMSL